VVVVTAAIRTPATTSTSIEFSAMARPMETATPVVPPRPAASEAPTATTLMWEASSALTSRVVARTVTVRESPSMTARVAALIRFSVKVPAPLAPTPVVPPPEIAAAAATTTARIVCVEVAVSETAEFE